MFLTNGKNTTIFGRKKMQYFLLFHVKVETQYYITC